MNPGKHIASIVILLSICLLNSVSQIPEGSAPSTFKYYLHLAHTRTQANPHMDELVEHLDYSAYDMLWLGGDMALSTSLDDTTMMHVDSILNLGNETTLWALGNHDYADLDRIQSFTHRPSFYAYHRNQLTFMVLDTQDSLSNITGSQKALFNEVVDTIQESTHLIVLTHKLIWMYGDSYLQPRIPSVTNGGFGDCFYCINPNNWYTDLYPRLLELEEKGIEVICIAGDIGFRVHEFSYETPAHIQYLASGIEAGDPDNRALLFKHDLAGNVLSWEFIKLSELQIPESSIPMEESLPSIYPNPSSGIVHISADQGTIALWVYDILGRAVISGESPESGFIDLSNEPGGLYLFCILVNGRKMVWEKVLIQ